MTKEQAYHAFLASFGWTTYDENTVPDDASLPRLTYNFADAEFDAPVNVSISIWDRTTSWASVTAMKARIFDAIGYGGVVIPFDGGKLWIKRGSPFAQRISDPDDTIRRIYINITIEFFKI